MLLINKYFHFFIFQLEKQIEEVAQLFKEIAVLVESQGEN